jgi:hypothetical protein
LGAPGEYYVGHPPHDFFGEGPNTSLVASGKTILALQITANDPPQPCEHLSQRGQFGS